MLLSGDAIITGDRSRMTQGTYDVDVSAHTECKGVSWRRRSARIALISLGVFMVCVSGGCANRSGRAAGGSSSPEPAPAAPISDRSVILVNAAEDAIRAGDRQRAIADLTRAIEINPTLTKAHLTLADVHRSDGDYEAAHASYRRAAELEPRNFDAQYYDGLMLHLLNRLGDAARAYLRALAVQPSDFQANLRLAGVYYQLDELSPALDYAQRATKIDPANGEARYQLGAIHAAMDDHAGAVREYQQATESMTLTPDLLLNLAESLGRLDRFTEMANTLEQAIRTQPSAAAWERLGFAHWRLGEFDAAHADFEAALGLEPDYFPALNGVGVSWLRRWRETNEQDTKARDQGVAHLRRSLQVKRDQPKVLELLTRYGN